MAFRGEQSSGGEDGLEDLTKAIIEDVLRMPGNEVCCDCGAAGASRDTLCIYSVLRLGKRLISSLTPILIHVRCHNSPELRVLQ